MSESAQIQVVAVGEAGTVVYDPEGWACNMRYAVLRDGREVHRGPQWTAHRAARTGIPFVDQFER